MRPEPMAIRFPIDIDIDRVKGFMPPGEGEALYRRAVSASRLGPCLEIGSYCGKSTVYLGTACKETGSSLFALDHHRGSEEHQLGQEYHDPELFDATEGVVDSFREFRRTLRLAALEGHVIPLVASSVVAARRWSMPLGLVFIDGGHSFDAALTDYRCWIPHLVPGGTLAIHDIFFDPAAGGQAPHTIWRMALASNLFAAPELSGTLGLLTRVEH